MASFGGLHVDDCYFYVSIEESASSDQLYAERSI
jgi:hypothetical protein